LSARESKNPTETDAAKPDAAAGHQDRAARVVQVGYNVVAASGGTTTAVLDFREALGGDVVSFTDASLDRTSPIGITHVDVGTGSFGRRYGRAAGRTIDVAAEIVRKADRIVIHSLFRHHAQWAWSIARRHQIPFWVVPHGALDPYVFSYRSWQKKGWMRLIGGRMLSGAAAVIFATERERKRALPFTREVRSRVVHWPVTPAILPSGGGAGTRHGLGLPSDARLLLFLGRLHPSKRVVETIQAFAGASSSRTHLIIAGPASDQMSYDDCLREVERAGVAGRAHVIGPVYGRDRDALFDEVDGFISLSVKENFGYSVAEACAAGLPVILSPGIDLADDLKPAACGWFLKSFQRDEATRAIDEFSSAAPQDLRKMGADGKSWTDRELNPDRFAKSLRELMIEGA